MERSDRKLIVDEVYGFIKIYSDGTVERPPFPGGYLSPCSVFVNGVATKDVDIDAHSGLWARLFLPECALISPRKVPVVLYFHGGGFCVGSPASASFHAFCSVMAIKSESIWVSVCYRLAPEHRLPAAYEDGFAAFMWLCLQSESQDLRSTSLLVANGSILMQEESSRWSGMRAEEASSFADKGTCSNSDEDSHASQAHLVATCKTAKQHDASCVDYWLLNYADFSNCFLAGDSAGGAIVHYLMGSLSRAVYSGIQIRGLLLIHSAFLVKGMYDESLNPNFERRPHTYRQLCLPIGAEEDHPLLNPLHPDAHSFKDIKFPPALIAAADQDRFFKPSLHYAHLMKQHGHMAELHISEEEGHCFYLYHPRSRKSEALYECLVAFMCRHCRPQRGISLL